MNISTLRVAGFAAAVALTSLPALAQDRVSIDVTNNTGQTITELYIDGAQLPAYSSNRLNGRTMDPGRRSEFGIESDSTCQYDLFARDNQGGEYTHRFSIAGCGSGGTSIIP